MNHDDATNSGGRTPGSKLPTSPPPWPSRPAGRRAKNASEMRQKSPFQSVSNLSMNGTEPRPRTAGNLSLHEHRDVHNRAGTAPAAPPGNSALSGPSGTCRAQQRARQNLIKNCRPSRRKRVKFFQKPQRLKPTWIHCRHKLSAEYGDNPEVISQRPHERA